MGKKRKTSGKGAPSRNESGHAASEPRTKLNVRSYEDVADSEDEFFLNRDQVLLDEGPARKKLRQLDEEDAFFQPSDEEVLPVPSSESENEEDYEDAVDVQDDGEDDIGGFESGARKELSDEEEGISGWGDARRDYYDGDHIETEADALEEEKEALRLQKKQLQGMTAADYGFDESEWVQDENTVGTSGQSKVLQEVLPELEISDSMTDEERARILSTRYPEFGPLSREFTSLQPAFDALNAEANAALRNDGTDAANFVDELPSSVVRRNVLGSYLGSLAMYFAILTSGTKSSTGQRLAKSPSEMRDHPIMETLVATRRLWEKIKDAELLEPVPRLQDLQLLEQSANANERATIAEVVAEPISTKKKKKSRKSAAQLEAEEALKAAETLRLERIRRVEADLAKISAPTRPAKQSQSLKSTLLPSATAQFDSDSDFGEAVAITAEEAEEKAQRKRGLRFYTSKITAKGLKRERATRERGGDTDIPHRERLRDRQIRLNEEAERRGAKADARVQLDAAAESDDEDRTARAALRGEDNADNDDDYYDLVATQTKRKKDAKTAVAAARQEAKIAGRSVEDGEQVGPDGKRIITYAIAKNKGLTPKRKKEGRNPRVKKRNQYEEKKKKLVNQRPVYKGGEGRGGYGGEMTGIRKNLVKSVKL